MKRVKAHKPSDKKKAPGAATPGEANKKVKQLPTDNIAPSMITCQDLVAKTVDDPHALSPPIEQKNAPRQEGALGKDWYNKMSILAFYCTIIPPLCPHLADLMTQARAHITRAERAGDYGRAWLHWLILRQLEQLNTREGWYRT